MRLLTGESATPNGLAPTTTNVPVVLFRYGERRKFVRVSGDYEETIDIICRAFKIAPNGKSTVSLQTSVLEVCKGIDTVIDESAYPLLWNYVDEMTVVVDADAEVEVEVGSEFERVSQETAASSSGSSRRAEKAPASQAQPKPKAHLPTPSIEVEEPAPTTRKSNVDKEKFPDDLLDFTSDHALEDPVEENKGFEEQPWEQPEPPVEEPMTARTESPVFDSTSRDPPPASRTVKKFKKPTGDVASSSRVVDDIFSPIKQEKDSDSTYTSEFSSKRGPKKEPTAPSGPKVEPLDDPRFEITIIGPENTCAQFKTRGKHQVRKVLAAACKTFDVDASRMHLVLRLEIDEDENEYQDYVCRPNETISQCGVYHNSKLFLKEFDDGYLD